ncbi:MAG: hypothetical protein K0S60_361 [Evtepia sp.]|jgi:hypothetical protein|nr:hypothetical protein [Evtepia sp.]
MAIIQTLKAKLTLRRRIALLIAFLILLIALIASLTIKDRLGLTLFTRWLTYDNEKGNITFSHGARSENLFLNLDYKLLVCSDTLLQLFSPTGDSLLKEPISFSNPALSSNEKQAVVYDAGGQGLYVVSKEKVAFSLTLPAGQYILSASINKNGWLAVTTKEDGHKGVVTIYNASYDPVVSIRLSSSYLVDALVAPDCKGVYILTPGQSSGIFESKLLYYNLKQAETPSSQISLGDNVVLSMRTANQRCWILSENELFILLPTGELAAKYDYNGKYIKRASLDGTEFATLLLSNSQSGNSGTLVTVDSEGVVLGSLDLQEQVLALSSSGRYVAVLTASCLRVYTKDLTETSVSNYIQGVQNLVLFPDGSLSLITDEFSRLYLP